MDKEKLSKVLNNKYHIKEHRINEPNKFNVLMITIPLKYKKQVQKFSRDFEYDYTIYKNELVLFI
jgi:hypothetical protein